MPVVPIVSVTGTKGKTTAVAVIADVLQKLDRNVLKVDTTGHFVNGERRSTLDDSKANWRLVPSVAPGRYLYEFFQNPGLQENGAAVLECSLGCSAMSGLAYRYHDVGIFLNVFEDHIGSSSRIKNKEDIAHAKQFIFSRLKHQDSFAVFNADDPLVVDRLSVLPVPEGITLIPFGFDFSEYDVTAHLEDGGIAITVADGHVVLQTKDGDTPMIELARIPWTFNGTFAPSLWNLMAALGGVYGYFGSVLPEGTREAFEGVRLDPYGGRLTLLKAQNGVEILADYAHEKVSLELVADLARTRVQNGGRVIGVVRMAHDRTDELLRETGRIIGESFDEVVVYDKIDGHFRQAKHATSFPQIVGRTSEVVAGAVGETNAHVTRILREDEALAYAASIAKPGDVVVFIVNDDIERSIGFVKDIFTADFV